MNRLTRRFTQFNIVKFEKATGKSLLDLLPRDGFHLYDLVWLLRIGNPDLKTEEDACNFIDKYIESNEAVNLLLVFFQVLAELDADTKILKQAGVDVKELYNKFMNEANKNPEVDNVDTVNDI